MAIAYRGARDVPDDHLGLLEALGVVFLRDLLGALALAGERSLNLSQPSFAFLRARREDSGSGERLPTFALLGVR